MAFTPETGDLWIKRAEKSLKFQLDNITYTMSPNAIWYVAGEQIYAGHAVSLRTDGKVYYTDTGIDEKCQGIALNDAILDGAIEVRVVGLYEWSPTADPDHLTPFTATDIGKIAYVLPTPDGEISTDRTLAAAGGASIIEIGTVVSEYALALSIENDNKGLNVTQVVYTVGEDIAVYKDVGGTMTVCAPVLVCQNPADGRIYKADYRKNIATHSTPFDKDNVVGFVLPSGREVLHAGDETLVQVAGKLAGFVDPDTSLDMLIAGESVIAEENGAITQNIDGFDYYNHNYFNVGIATSSDSLFLRVTPTRSVSDVNQIGAIMAATHDDGVNPVADTDYLVCDGKYLAQAGADYNGTDYYDLYSVIRDTFGGTYNPANDVATNWAANTTARLPILPAGSFGPWGCQIRYSYSHSFPSDRSEAPCLRIEYGSNGGWIQYPAPIDVSNFQVDLPTTAFGTIASLDDIIAVVYATDGNIIRKFEPGVSSYDHGGYCDKFGFQISQPSAGLVRFIFAPSNNEGSGWLGGLAYSEEGAPGDPGTPGFTPLTQAGGWYIKPVLYKPEQWNRFFDATADQQLRITYSLGFRDLSFSTEFGNDVITQAAGQFDRGAVDPTDTTRLNYNGNLYINNLYATADIVTDSGNLVTTDTSATVFDTTATTVDAFGAATTLSVGHDGVSASTTNIANGATAAATKAINIGTGATVTGITNITIGSAVADSVSTTIINGVAAPGTAPLQIINRGALGVPAVSGVTQTFGISRHSVRDSTGALDIGLAEDAAWIQSTDSADLSIEYDLLLNPNGGNVGIGTLDPDSPLDVAATSAQLRLTYTDGTVYTTFGTDSGGDLTITPTGGDTVITGTLKVTGGTLSTDTATFNLLDTTVTTANILGEATTINFGYDAAAAVSSTINIGISQTDSGNTKAINLGTGGDSGSTTTISLGSANAGAISNTIVNGLSAATVTPFRVNSLIGSSGLPATSSTTQTYGIARFSTSATAAVLDIGSYGAPGLWIQSTDSADLSVEYPLLLNPNGGHVAINDSAPKSSLDTTGDITVGFARRLLFNVYNDGSYRYKANGEGAAIYQSGNSLRIATFASGSADAIATERTQIIVDGINQCVGIGSHYPTTQLDVQKAGTGAQTLNILKLTNSANAASMDSTGTAIAFDQYAYDAVTPAAVSAGRIAVVTEGNWLVSDVNTQDSSMSFQVAVNGSLVEKLKITSAGLITVANSLTITDILTANGAVNLGNAAADIITITGTISNAGLKMFDVDGDTYSILPGSLATNRTITLPAPTVDTKYFALTDNSSGTLQAGDISIGAGAAGAIVYSTATVLALTAAGSAGQILQSAGANAPTWSTPTYPSASGTAGKILRSDGTNVIYSTPTFPNTATLNKILVGDGTNWIESTPTFPNASATAGKVIISDGTNWIASTPIMPNAVSGVGTILRSNGTTGWTATTATYPATTTAYQLLVSTATSVVGEITVGATGTVLIGNTGAVPSFSSTPAVTSITTTTLYVNHIDERTAAHDIIIGVGTGTASVAIGTETITEKFNVLGDISFGPTAGKVQMKYNAVESSIDFIIN